eukprot:m.464392 g.464392  ORF g.464392 m.464392 type:complete len:239 (+) comp21618_c0_seq3:119-835(+)
MASSMLFLIGAIVVMHLTIFSNEPAKCFPVLGIAVSVVGSVSRESKSARQKSIIIGASIFWLSALIKGGDLLTPLEDNVVVKWYLLPLFVVNAFLVLSGMLLEPNMSIKLDPELSRNSRTTSKPSKDSNQISSNTTVAPVKEVAVAAENIVKSRQSSARKGTEVLGVIPPREQAREILRERKRSKERIPEFVVKWEHHELCERFSHLDMDISVENITDNRDYYNSLYVQQLGDRMSDE